MSTHPSVLSILFIGKSGKLMLPASCKRENVLCFTGYPNRAVFNAVELLYKTQLRPAGISRY